MTNNLFNKDFFPTPDNVIEQMLNGIDITNKVILEPSAGKGNIVDYLKANGAKEVIACEMNKDLKMILSKKCRIISDDFLKVRAEEISHVDLIVMNPPFSADERHILHAFEIAPEGCTIISLCNSATINNQYTTSRVKLGEKINLYGYSQEFGSCFDEAERKTGVEISCIWLNKPKSGDNEFDGYFSTNEEVEGQGEGLLQYNYVRDMVSRYTESMRLFDQIEPIAQRMNEITSSVDKWNYKTGVFARSGRGDYSEITRENFKKQLQKSCWAKIFDDMNMDKYITSGVKADINRFVEQQQQIPFTMTNIYKMLDVIVGTHGNTMNRVIMEAFEKICNYSWMDNCTGGEHWKTNSNYMVNRKFIVPYLCEGERYGTRYEFVELCYRSSEQLEDICKALCHLTGTDYHDIQDLRSFVSKSKMEWGKWYDWGFFRIRGYKKGTMHFEFIDEDVWAKFNLRAAEIKGWSLPYQSKTNKKTKKYA